MDLHQIILNIILVSIPEEIFLGMMILILMKQVEFINLDTLKRNFIRFILVWVIPVSMFSNITLIIIGTYYNVPLNIFFNSICLCVLLKAKKSSDILKYMFFSVIGMMILITTNQISLFLCKVILQTDISYFIGIHPIENFKLFLPERLLEYYILSIAFIKVNGSRENNIVTYIYKNSRLRIIIFFTYLINLAFFFSILKSFILDDSLIMVETGQKIVIVTVSISLIILNLAIPWIIAFTIYSSEDKIINFKE